MEHTISHRNFSFASAVVLASVLGIAGCQTLADHPDQQVAVYKALDSNDLGSIMVSQDREKGTITLTGIVAATNRKSQAVAIAKQAAPAYSIIDEIKVDPAGI